jgi:hypothetical protein
VAHCRRAQGKVRRGRNTIKAYINYTLIPGKENEINTKVSPPPGERQYPLAVLAGQVLMKDPL